jgi:hypothetical protein
MKIGLLQLWKPFTHMSVWEIWRNPITCHAHDCQMKIGLLRLWKPFTHMSVWEIWRNPITCYAHDCQMKIGLLRLWKPFTHMSQCEKSEQTPLHVMPSPLLICHSVRNLKKPHYMSCPWLSNENCASVAMKVLQYSRRYSVINQW